MSSEGHSNGNAVLIVEDHDDIRDALREVVESAGCRAIACAQAVDALGVLQGGERVCLILLDLVMPDLTGFQLREEQSSDPRLREIPVVVISGVARPQEYHGNLRAVEYLPKPIPIDRVIALVRRYCNCST